MLPGNTKFCKMFHQEQEPLPSISFFKNIYISFTFLFSVFERGVEFFLNFLYLFSSFCEFNRIKNLFCIKTVGFKFVHLPFPFQIYVKFYNFSFIYVINIYLFVWNTIWKSKQVVMSHYIMCQKSYLSDKIRQLSICV